MESLLLWIGRIAGMAGVALSTWAAFSRLSGEYFVGGFQIGTLLLGGMTAMLVACISFLIVLTDRVRK